MNRKGMLLATLLAATPAYADPAVEKNWNEWIARFVKAKAEPTRNCSGKLGLCVSILTLRTPDGLVMLSRAEWANGKIYRRELCNYNVTGDIQLCRDFDTGQQVRKVKDSDSGRWVKQ